MAGAQIKIMNYELKKVIKILKFKIIKILYFAVLFILLYPFVLLPLTYRVYADELDEIQKQINDLQKQLESSVTATTPLQNQLDKFDSQIKGITLRINNLEKQLNEKRLELAALESDISQKEKDLAFEKEIFGKTVRSTYIRNRQNHNLLVIFGQGNVGNFLRELGYYKALEANDRSIILTISYQIKDLDNKKQQATTIKTDLEKQQKGLASARAQVDKEADFFRKEIAKARSFQSSLSLEISKLSARQQEILSAKFGTFTTSVGDVPLPDDFNASPAFNPGFSPAFAGFSFGAFTHRNGMSQYGALGRAQSGQNAEQILSHYYPGASLNKNYSVPANISVSGFGTMSFEDTYMKRIYEVPNSWPKEVLKAQAVAARTYAVRYTNNGANPICTTQSCQVYKNSDKGGAWNEAVAETRGWVLEGGPSAQYSSTSGGYLNTSGWDTTSGDRNTWTSGAYEKLAGSPWFYKAWYTESYTVSSAKCGRSHPWLNQSDFADILNAWIVYSKGNDQDKGRISPVDTACWGGNPYSNSQMSSRANELGGGVNTVSTVNVTYSQSGSTATVTLGTNTGTMTLSGADFKNIFNLRAPGYISIRSALFNIERK